jgi:hypothetical protein
MQHHKQQNETPLSLYDIIAPTDLRPDELGGWMHRYEEGGDLEPGTFRIGECVFDVQAWTKGAKPHWLTPPMRDDDREALEGSIAEQGILEDITITHKGEVPDGYHRLNAWLRQILDGNILPPPPYRLVRFHNVESESTFVMSQNIARRHLDHDDKVYIVKQLLQSGHAGTDGWLAKIVRIHAETVRDVRAALEALPVEQGGIEFKEHRVSSTGRNHKQKRIEPETQKRRKEARLEASANELEEEESEILGTCDAAVDTQAGPTKEENILRTDEPLTDHYSTISAVDDKQECSASVIQDEDLSDDLRQLVSDWWAEFQFLPTMSKELAAIVAQREGREPEKGDADRLTRMLKGKVGERVCGHLILHRTMAANVAVFMLAPPLSIRGHDLDWRVLNQKAGKRKLTP